MLAFTRTQPDMASSAASRAERHHSICFPSGGGSRTGQKNRVPCRLTAVYNVLVTNSPASSGTRPAATMYSSRSSLSSMIGKLSRYAGLGWTRTKSCGLGLRTGTVTRNFFTPTVSVNDWFRRRFVGSKGSSAGVLVSVSGSTACKVGLVMTETPVLKVFEWTAYPARSSGVFFYSAGRAAGGVGRAPDGWIDSWEMRLQVEYRFVSHDADDVSHLQVHMIESARPGAQL